MNSSTTSKRTLIPVELEGSIVGTDTLNLYFNWLEHLGIELDPDVRPWVPVGNVGPILIFAHDNPLLAPSLPLPEWVTQQVSVSTEDYEGVLAYVTGKTSIRPLDFEAPSATIPDSRVSFANVDSLIGFILENFFLRPADRALLKTIRPRLSGFSYPADMPEGLPETCQFLHRSDILIMDPRCVDFNADLSKAVPERSNFANACAGVSIDQAGVAYFLAGKIRNELIDAILAKRSGHRKNIRLILSPGSLLLAALQERTAKQTRVEFQKSDGKNVGSGQDTSQQHITLDEAVLSKLTFKDATISSENLFHLSLYTAIRAGASDIHFEQVKGRGQIRIRVDGSLRILHQLSAENSKGIIGVVKNGGIEGFTTNNYDAQDARSSVRLGANIVNIRASLQPHFKNGYQVLVIRLLPKHNSLLSLDKLGIADRDMRILRRAITRTSGLILVTGPTGSGKTTTLYACLNEINKPDVRITTMEDPVEIELDGATQSAVDEAHEIGFPELLRAALRQDPDIILIGEIRDTETARKALEAACTGHLVFATLHANSESDAVSRLMDLLDDPTQLPVLAKSLILLQSQRLVRRLCKKCRKETKPSEVEAEIFKSRKILLEHYLTANHEGCKECYEGYSGRTAIMSLLPVMQHIAEKIATGANAFEIRRVADEIGLKSLYHEALERVAEGETSLAEASDWEDAWSGFNISA